jgi:hypothetical protein
MLRHFSLYEISFKRFLLKLEHKEQFYSGSTCRFCYTVRSAFINKRYNRKMFFNTNHPILLGPQENIHRKTKVQLITDVNLQGHHVVLMIRQCSMLKAITGGGEGREGENSDL